MSESSDDRKYNRHMTSAVEIFHRANADNDLDLGQLAAFIATDIAARFFDGREMSQQDLFSFAITVVAEVAANLDEEDCTDIKQLLIEAVDASYEAFSGNGNPESNFNFVREEASIVIEKADDDDEDLEIFFEEDDEIPDKGNLN